MTDRLSLIAGSGALVPEVIDAAIERGFAIQVLTLMPRRLPAGVASVRLDLRDLQSGMNEIRRFGADRLAMAGGVTLTDSNREALLRQAGGAAATLGDTGMSRFAGFIETQTGARLVGVHEIAPQLLAPDGQIAGPLPSPQLVEVGKAALRLARQAGALDLGQGIVVAGQRVIALEDVAGTDALLRRVAQYHRRGLAGDGRSPLVFAKAMKPDQPAAIDLPAIGPKTVTAARGAGIALIAVQAGGTLLIQRAKLAQAAAKAGLPIVGLTPDE